MPREIQRIAPRPISSYLNPQSNRLSSDRAKNSIVEKNWTINSKKTGPKSHYVGEDEINRACEQILKSEVKKCTICLEEPRIRGVLDTCSHVFCFDCIHRWSSTANTCPHCLQRFRWLRKVDMRNMRKKYPMMWIREQIQRVHYDDDPSLIAGIFDSDLSDSEEEEDDLEIDEGTNFHWGHGHRRDEEQDEESDEESDDQSESESDEMDLD
eukprot:TRINITY_DN5114_c0_g1_i1.p1 TRINITY_DN5114_c0_g1~~TRINITY_DN5114_c0_g1_i1.p1  ORF type:complete len:211 (-),score=50.59 TRINITY_DN5114_c0_g1_i1:67-699(-)